VRRELNVVKLLPPRVVFLLLVGVLWSPVLVSSQTEGADSLAQGKRVARAGNFDAAATEYRKLLEGQPRSAVLWSNLAAVEAMGGHCDEAFPALDRARSLNPTLFAPWYFAGVCDLQFHKDERALTDLARASAINPRDPNAWYLQVQAAANLDRLELAFQFVLKGLPLDSKRPDAYYQAGKLALDLAARCYDRVMGAPANSPYPHELEGDRNAAQDLPENGIDSYRKALSLAPENPAIHFTLANAYVQAGKLSDAEAELRKCLELLGPMRPGIVRRGAAPETAPRTEWVRLRLALVLAREGQPGRARQILQSIQPERLEAPEEFEDFLSSARLLNMPDLTGKILHEALARFPGDTELGQWQTRLAQPVSASSDQTTLSDRSTGSARVGLAMRFIAASSPRTGSLLALMFSSPDRYRKFRSAFLRNDEITSAGTMIPSVQHLPADPAEAFALGSLLQWLSYRFFERLAEDYPDSEAAQRLAAENLSAAGEQEKALEIYQAILERNGPSPDLLRAIAQIRWSEHQWGQALEVLELLKKLDGRDPTTLVNLGRIYSYKQDFARSEDCFRQAIEADPQMFEAHLGLGEALRRRGDEEGALGELKIASEIQPQNAQPHYVLSQIYRKHDRAELAREEMAIYQRLQAQAGREKTRVNRLLVPLD
jgi:tetratricopeptide (TPR) repeat protein